MDVSGAMDRIVKEAQRQGFLVTQTQTAMWRFSKGPSNVFIKIGDVDDILTLLSALITAGLNWSAFSTPVD